MIVGLNDRIARRKWGTMVLALARNELQKTGHNLDAEPYPVVDESSQNLGQIVWGYDFLLNGNRLSGSVQTHERLSRDFNLHDARTKLTQSLVKVIVASVHGIEILEIRA